MHKYNYCHVWNGEEITSSPWGRLQAFPCPVCAQLAAAATACDLDASRASIAITTSAKISSIGRSPLIWNQIQKISSEFGSLMDRIYFSWALFWFNLPVWFGLGIAPESRRCFARTFGCGCEWSLRCRRHVSRQIVRHASGCEIPSSLADIRSTKWCRREQWPFRKQNPDSFHVDICDGGNDWFNSIMQCEQEVDGVILTHRSKSH